MDADVRIMTISDVSIEAWDEALRVADGTVGEIVVKGPAVTASYFGREELNALAKMRDTDGETLHRMGDLGYFDADGRLWYCGRKAHRVQTSEDTLFTEQVEGIFNAHPMVKRSALVGVSPQRPVICIELKQGVTADHETVRTELLDMACQHSLTCEITTVLFHPNFPVDVRHNSKIVREKLTLWAQQKLS
jgi:olefin beta-lactone synthetase